MSHSAIRNNHDRQQGALVCSVAAMTLRRRGPKRVGPVTPDGLDVVPAKSPEPGVIRSHRRLADLLCHNLTRAAGCLADASCAKARGTTIRSQLIAVAARIACHGRGHITMHLPEGTTRPDG